MGMLSRSITAVSDPGEASRILTHRSNFETVPRADGGMEYSKAEVHLHNLQFTRITAATAAVPYTRALFTSDIDMRFH